MFYATVVYARRSRLIAHWPDSAPARWSHAGIIIPPVVEDHDDGYWVWHATWPRGFHCVTLEDFQRHYSHRTEFVRYAVERGPSEQRAWCQARQGQRYALGTVLGRMFGLRASENSGDHCSEVVENFLAAMGLQRWREGHHLVTPNASYNNLMGDMQ